MSVRTPCYNFGQVSILFTYIFNQVRCAFHLIYKSYLILFLVDSTTFQSHLSLFHLLSLFLTQPIKLSKIVLACVYSNSNNGLNLSVKMSVKMCMIFFCLQVHGETLVTYGLNLEYPRKLRYSFEFLQKVVLNIKPDQCSARVHGLRNKLLRYRQ